MNRIFKVVWNRSLKRFIVASELAKGAKKDRTHKKVPSPKTLMALTMLASASLLFGPTVYAEKTPLNILYPGQYDFLTMRTAQENSHFFADDSKERAISYAAAVIKEAPVVINNDDISSSDRVAIQYNVSGSQRTAYFNKIEIDYDILQSLTNPINPALTVSTKAEGPITTTGDQIALGTSKTPIVIEGDVYLERTESKRGLEIAVNTGSKITGTLRVGSGNFASQGIGNIGSRSYNTLSLYTNAFVENLELYTDDSLGDGSGDVSKFTFHNGSHVGHLHINPSGLASMEEASHAMPNIVKFQGNDSIGLESIYGERPYLITLLGTKGTFTLTEDTVWGGDPESLKYSVFQTTTSSTTTVLTNANNYQGGRIALFDPTSTKLVFDSTFQGSLPAQITGKKGSVLIKSGADVKYTFDGAHTFTSGTTIDSGGTLTLTNPGQVGKTSPTVDVYAGKIAINGTLVLTEGALSSSKEFAGNLSGAGILELQGSEPIGLKPINSFEFSHWQSSFTGSLAISNINFDITNGGDNQKIANQKDFYINHHGWANLSGNTTLKNVYLNEGILNLTALGDDPAKISGNFGVLDKSYLAIDALEEITNNDLSDLNDMHSKVLINFDKAQSLDEEQLDNLYFMDGEGNEYSALTSDIKGENDALLGTAQYQYQGIQTGDKALSVTYKITQLDIHQDKVIELGVKSSNYTLGALIMGAGGIELAAGDYAITLNNTNTYAGGTTVTSGRILAGKDQAFGVGGINIASGAMVDLNRKTQTITTLTGNGLLLLNSGHLTLNNSGDVNTGISGSGNLYITGDSTFNLANSNLNAVIEIKEEGTLTEGAVGAFGDSSLEVLGTAILNNQSKTLDYVLTGTGVVNVTADGFRLNNDKLQDYQGTLRIVDNASIDLKTTDNLYKTQLELDSKGVLQLHAAEDYAFSAQLKGTGLFDVNLGGNSFSTQSKNMNSFAGTLQLTNTRLSLVPAQSLQKTMIAAGADSIVIVDDYNRIGGLTFTGGKVEFTNDDSHLDVTNLDLSQGGSVIVTNDTIGTAGGEKTGSIIDQSNDQAFLDLITSSNQVKGDVSDIKITLNGKEVIIGDENTDIVDYVQQGEKVAELSYGYGAMTTSNGRDGLFVTYGLEEVKLLVEGENALVLETKGDQNFGTLLSGNGGIIFDVTKGDLTLDYSNIYTGSSLIRGGSADAIKTVTALQNNVLGMGGLLTIAQFSAFDLNGKNQSLSGLKGAGVLDLNAGILTLTEGGDIATELSGNGAVIFTTGENTITNRNQDLNAQITINQDARLNFDTDVASLGIGQIRLEGKLGISGTNDYTIDQGLEGAGQLSVNLSGKQLSFTEQAGISYTGILNLINTELDFNSQNQAPIMNAQLYLGNQSILTVAQQGVLNTLKFDKGTANFTSSDGELTLQNLDYSGGGTINLTFDTSDISSDSSLIEASEKAIDWDVMIAENIQGDLSNTVLTINGHAHNPADDSIFNQAYQQNGEHVADVVYGYEISEVKDALKGLFVKSGIQSIDILDTKTLELALTSKDGSFGTLLTGSGSLLLNAGDYSLIMNETNRYTGNTTIGSGIVYANADNVFGDSALLTLEKGATFDLTNKKQTLESLQGTGILKIEGGILTLTQGGEIDARLQGTGNIAFNAGETIVNSDNADLQASINIGENATLTTGSMNALGLGELIISGKLNIAHSLNNVFSGSGEINTEVDFALATDQGQNFAGNYNVNKGQFSIDSGTQMGSASFNIADIGTLLLSGDSDTTFNQALTGLGSFNVNLGGKGFNFGKNAGQLYEGILKLENTLLNLGNAQAETSGFSNGNALKNATLWAGDQSVVTIGQNNNLQSLVIAGGALVYDNDSTILNVENLTLTRGNLSVSGNLDITGTDNGASLIAQSNKAGYKTIVISDNAVIGDIGNIAIRVNGEAITNEDNSSESKYYQTNAGVSEYVADLMFDYTWSTTNTAGQYGIFANYQLSTVKILAEKILNLTATAIDNRFDVVLSGEGGVLLAGGENTALIIAKTNSYTGSTTINGGDIEFGAHNALGVTSSLNLDKGILHLKAFNQTVGELNSTGGTINLGGGSLTVERGGHLENENALKGAGNITLQGGNLIVDAGNNDLSATITVDQPATITLSNDASNLGSGDLLLSGALNANGNVSIANNLQGQGDVNVNANTALTGNNNTFAGNFHVTNAGNLNIDSTQKLGNASIINLLGSLNISGDNNENQPSDLSQTLTGIGTVKITDSILNIGGNNVGFTGQYHFVNSTGVFSANEAFGKSSALAVYDNSNVTFDYNVGALTAALTGSGTLNFTQGSVSLGAANASNYAGSFVLKNDADFNLGTDVALGSASFDVSKEARLNILGATDYQFSSGLMGSGLLDINLGGKTFTFGDSVGNHIRNNFNGNILLKNTLFNLGESSNSAGVINSILSIGADSVVTIGQNNHLKGLILNEGTLSYSQNSNTLNVANLTLTGGTLNVTSSGRVTIEGSSLIAQSNQKNTKEIILSENSVEGTLSDIEINLDGTIVDLSKASTTTQQYLDGSDHIANLTYSYDWNTAQNGKHGIFANYGLSIVEILQSKTLNLSSKEGESSFGSIIEGAGNLWINASLADFTLAKTNSYTGSTTITAGKVVLGADNALGKTSQLNVNSGASLDIAGKIQTVGNIDNSGTIDVAAGNITAGDIGNKGTIDLTGGSLTASETTNSGTIDVAGGNLTTDALNNSGAITLGAGNLIINNGGSLNAGSSISGDGSLQLTSGTLAVSSSNDLTGTVLVSENAEVNLLTGSSLGTAAMSLAGKLLVNADLAINNQLSGNGSVVINATTNFTKDNSAFTGSYHLNTNGLLTVSALNQIGANSKILLNAGTLTFNGIVSGAANQSFSGNGAVNLTSSILSLTGDNSAYTGDYHLTDNSQLAIAGNNNLGTGKVSLDGSSELVLSNDYGTTLVNEVAGAGLLSLSNITLSVLDNKLVNLSGTVGIGGNTTLNLNDKTMLNSSATLNIDANGQINWANSSTNNLTLNNKVLGSGLLSIDGNHQSLILDSVFGNNFAGTLQLTNSLFEFNNSNNNQLGKSTLVLNFGANVSLLADSTVNGLVLDGGRLNFTGNIAGGSQADSILTVTNGITLDGGDIYMIGNAPEEGSDPSNSGKSLLDQMGSENSTLLVSGAVSGDTSNLDLYINDSKIDTDSTVKSIIEQGGITVAEGEYSYGLISQTGVNQGLYLHYGLQSLNLLTDDANALQITTTTNGNNNLSVVVSGIGGLSLNAAEKDLLISNAGNSYIGSTTITAGKVILEANNALGKTSQLNVNNDASLDIAGKTQTVGNIDNNGTIAVSVGNLTAGDIGNKGTIDLTGGNLTAAETTNSGTISLGGGNLTTDALKNNGAITLGTGNLIINNGGSLNAGSSISGTGSLQLTAGTLAVSSSNDLTGTVSVSENSEVRLETSESSLGTAAMSLAGKLLVNADLTINNQLSGNGSVVINATTNFTKDNSTFTGKYNLNTNGLLTVSALNQIGANSKILLNAGTLTFNGITEGLANQSFSGNGAVNLTSSILSLTGDNSAYTGDYHLTDNSQLGIAGNNNLGSGTVNLDGTSMLALSDNYGTILANEVAGAGSLSLANISLSVFDNKLEAFTGAVNLSKNATWKLNGNTILSGQGSVANSLTLNHKVTGSGLLDINAGNETLLLGSNFGGDFAGTLQLANTSFTFDHTNKELLQSTGLLLNAGSKITVSAESKVSSLVLNGGEMSFTANIPGAEKADNVFTVSGNTTLTSGKINVTGSETTGTISTKLPLLDQMTNEHGTLLVDAEIQGDLSQLELTINGNTITKDDNVVADISQGGSKVAEGNYNYGLASQSEGKNGLYLHYGLQSIHLIADGDDALAFATTEDGNNNLSVLLTGDGGIVLDASLQDLDISNTGNNYQGTTTINGGVINLLVDKALGNTSKLVMNDGTLNLNDHTQKVGAVNINGTINIADGGKLIITNGGSLNSNNALSGIGSVDITGGNLVVNDSNDAFTGAVSIDQSASTTLSNTNSNLGSGNLVLAGTLNVDGENNDIQNSLSGAGTVNINADTTLTGADNRQFGGLFAIGAGNALTVTSADFLGNTATVELGNTNASLNIASENAGNDAGNLTQTLKGNGHLNIANSTLAISGDHSGFTGSYHLNDSQVSIVSGKALGKNTTLDINDRSIVSLDYSVGQFDQTLKGQGTLNFTTGSATLGNIAAQDFDGTILLSNSAELNVSTEAELGSIAAGANLVTFDVNGKNSTLNIHGDKNFIFIAGLKGAGIVNIDLNNASHKLDLYPDTNDEFTGILNISNASLELDINTSTFLKTAIMGVGKNADVRIMDGKHRVGGVYLNGGNIYFKDLHDDAGSANLESDGTILVDSLDISDQGGTIYVMLPKALNPDPIGSGLGILDYDDGSTVIQLAEASSVTGAIGNLELKFVDEDNDELVNNELEEDLGDGVTGIFNYKFTQGTGKNLGLYVSYGLKSLSVTKGNAVLLGNPATGNLDLSSSVSGEGGITINTDPNNIITLSNGENSYTGETIVITGGLRLEASGALGDTSQLTLHETTTFDLNGKTQAIGKIFAAQNTAVTLGGGVLTIHDGGEIAGTLTGSGRVTLDGPSTLELFGNNSDLTALFDVDDKATLNVHQITSAGSGLLALSDDDAQVNYLGVKGLVKNSWTGSGNISIASNDKGEHSEVVLTKDNTGFNGHLFVAENNQLTVTDVKQIAEGSVDNRGTLIYHLSQKQVLNDHITGTGDFIKRGAALSIENLFDYAGNIRIESGNVSLSATGVLGVTTNSGIYIANGAALNGVGVVNGATDNHGLLQVGTLESTMKRSNDKDPETLILMSDLNNYNRINIAAAEGSAVVGNSLVIKGNYTGFEDASIYMNASLGNNETSKVDNLIIEGEAKGQTTLYVHDFRNAGVETDKQGIKIIDTQLSEEEAFVLGNTVMSGAYEYRLQHDASDQNWYLSSYTDPAYRPDIGNNVSNVTVVTQSMVPGLNGLSGMRSLSRSWGDDLLKSSIWNTTGGSKSKGKTGNGQVSYHSDFLSTAFGGDHVFETETSAIQLGLMMGTMKAKSHSSSLITGSSGKSRVTGQTYGIYGSWFVDIHNPLSAYVDGSISYGNYNNKIMTTGNADISYRSHIWSYTVQGGYPISISENYVLEPQAQLTYLDYSASSYIDPSKTHTKQAVKGDVVARIGAFIYPKGGDIRPYAGINIWYDNTYATVSHDGITNRADKAGMMIEAKAGVNAQLDKNFTISVDGHYRKGKHSIQDYGVGLTINYAF